jgi:hypothetical protein
MSESARATSVKTTAPAPTSAAKAPSESPSSSIAILGNQAIQAIYRSAIAEPPCECGGKCPKCQTKVIARDAADGGAAPPAPAIPNSVASVLASGSSSPLPHALRRQFEPRLGVSLADVRLHTGHDASESARAINANAYSSGTSIVFGSGGFAPDTTAGRRLLAHELTHVAQFKRSSYTPTSAISSPGDPAEREAKAAEHGDQGPPGQAGRALVHRQEPKDVLAPPAEGAGDKDDRPAALPKAPPPARNETDIVVGGVVVAGNPERTKYDLKRIAGTSGRQGVVDFVRGVNDEYKPRPNFAPERPFGTPMTAANYVPQVNVMGALAPIAREVLIEIDAYVRDFQAQAKSVALTTLDANEKQANDEAAHYGITTKKTEVPVSDCLAGDCKYEKREHSMDADSAGAKELQEVAKILLARRKDIDDTRSKAEQYHHTKCDHQHGDCVDTYDPPYAGLSQQLEEKIAEYNRLRDTLSNKYPILEDNSKMYSSTSDLSTIAKKGPGSEMAELLGEQIAEKLSKIAKSRAGLETGEVNVWRLPKMVALARLSMQTDAEPWKKKVIDDAVKQNEPGIWQAIALAVLNIVALLLAGPTGGISLAVAAGVNVAVAAYDVKKYIMEDALANSSFRAAQALSDDKPSLFWLALEIVGAVVDVGGAAAALSKSVTAFRTLGPMVEAAKIAEEGKDAEEAIRKVVATAEKLKGAKVAMRIEQEIRAARAAAGKAELIAAGATSKEIEGLERIGAAGDKAVLGETKALELPQMKPDQVQRELGLVKTKGTPVEPAEGYVEAIRLDNGHTWQRTADGKWCRFSNGMCLIFGERGGYHIETPPTTHLPVSKGTFEGPKGNSAWLSDDPAVLAVTNWERVPYKDGYPDFSRWSRGQVGMRQTTDRVADFAVADRIFAEQQSKLYSGSPPNPWLYHGQPNASAADRYRKANNLIWHHHQDGFTMQLIPEPLHSLPHSGGVSTL